MLDDAAVTADSAPATPDQSADTSAGTQNTGQPAQNGQTPQYKGFHEHPDWQRMVQERRQDRQVIADLNRRLQGLDQRTQQQTGPQPSPEEMQAAEALRKLIGQHPELKGMLDAPKYGERLESIEGAFRQFMAQQSQAQVQNAVQRVASLAKAENLPASKEYLQRLVKLVAAEAQGIENGDARYKAGDLSVLDEAFNSVKAQFLSHHQRQGAAALGANKLNLTNQVPPRQSGGQSGAVAPKPLTGDFRKDMSAMNDEADAMLRNLIGKQG